MQDALHTLTNGLYVVGSGEKSYFAGALVDALTQISSNPLMIMLSMMNTSHTLSSILKEYTFSLSVLSKETEPFIISNFGYQSGHNIKKWEEIDYDIKDDLPYIPNALAQIKFKLTDKIEYPNNTLLIAEPVKYYKLENKTPLTYKYYREHLKPLCQNTFKLHNTCDINATPKEIGKNFPHQKKKYICTICQYEYDGALDFELLDSSWRCPYCGVLKDMFKQI